MDKKRVIGIRTKTKYVEKPTEYRDNTSYWRKRLIENPPAYYYKHNQHGVRSPLFRISKIKIVDSPEEFLKEGVLKTERAIKIISHTRKLSFPPGKNLSHT